MIDWDRLEDEIADAGRGERIADRVVQDARRRRHRRTAVFAACGAVVAAGVAVPLVVTAGGGVGDATAGSVPPTSHVGVSVRAQIYAAALGGGPHPQPLHSRVYVRDHICAGIASNPGAGCADDPIPQDVQTQVADVLGRQVRFVARPPSPARLGDPAIVTLGRLSVQGNSAKLGMGVFCGPLCGEGMTLVLRLHEGQWQVTGNTGPQWIS